MQLTSTHAHQFGRIHPRTFSLKRAVGAWLVAALMISGHLFHASTVWAQTGLGIAAVVNDDVISMLDLDSRITMVVESAQLENTPESRMKIAHQVLRGLIDEKLKIQETRRSNITVSQTDIDYALQDIAKKNKMSIEQLSEHLQSLGVPISTLTARVEAELSWNLYVQRRLAKKIQIGAEEINDTIELIKSNAGKPEYLLGEIFLPIESSAQDSEVRQTAERLLIQLQQGAPFSALARNFSRAPSAALDGDMGWVQPSNLDPTLLRVITGMQPSTASAPVRTLGGYYIMLLRNIRTSPGLGGGDASLKLSQYHVPAPKGNDPATLNALSTQLVAATRTMTSCAQLEAAGAKSGSLMSGSLGEMKLSTLPDAMKKVLSTLKVGQPSAPIATGGGLAVLMICGRTDEIVDMKKIRGAIRGKLIQGRLGVAEQRKLRDLRRDAFVDVRL